MFMIHSSLFLSKRMAVTEVIAKPPVQRTADNPC